MFYFWVIVLKVGILLSLRVLKVLNVSITYVNLIHIHNNANNCKVL